MLVFPFSILPALSGCSPSAPVDAGAPDAPRSDAPVADDAGREDGGVDPCAGGACDPCDADLALDDDDPMNAARALGACTGLVEASWVLPDGSMAPSSTDFARGHGLLDGFGTAVVPQEGARLLALSSGTARDPGDPGYAANLDRGYTHPHPVGFPFEPPACPGVIGDTPHDGIALELTLTVPAGANGFRVRLKHHTSEWPAYLCNASNDISAVFVSPAPPGAHESGDVALDADGNPLSVNTSLLEVCTCAGGPPCVVGARSFTCSAGAGELAGTGFDAATSAATEWLELRVPATAGASIEVRFAVWDAADGILDATTLYDDFRWISDAPSSPELAVAP